jgi:hypothetical protein
VDEGGVNRASVTLTPALRVELVEVPTHVRPWWEREQLAADNVLADGLRRAGLLLIAESFDGTQHWYRSEVRQP